MLLPDGVAIPAFLSVSGSEAYSSNPLGTDPFLRTGRVLKVHNPNDKSNISKKYIEYDVEVDYYDNRGAYSKLVYYGVLVSSLFGGIADFTRYTPRLVEPKDINKLSEGSYVLIQCVNGDPLNAIIVGGVQHPYANSKDNLDDGHNYQSEFNGINYHINKDGEWKLKFRGATNELGNLIGDKKAEGTFIQLQKDGSLLLQSADNKQSYKINHSNHKIEIKADSEMTIDCNGHVLITSGGVYLGGNSAVDAIVKGTTWRSHEQQMHLSMQVQLGIISAQVSIAGAQISAAAAAHVVPIVGPIVGAPLLAAAGAALTSAVASITALQTAIASYEATAPTILSNKNFTD